MGIYNPKVPKTVFYMIDLASSPFWGVNTGNVVSRRLWARGKAYVELVSAPGNTYRPRVLGHESYHALPHVGTILEHLWCGVARFQLGFAWF